MMWYVNNFFQLECLQAHNRFRALHGCPPLKLNKHLTEFATNWAQKLGELNILEHTNVKVYGENVFMAERMQINGESAAKFWYKERKNYNPQCPKYTESSSNFTQIVWKESSHLGVGGCVKGDVAIVVTHYYPPGNVRGQFAKNVPPLIFEETLQQRRTRILEQQQLKQQQNRIYCHKLLEYHKRQRWQRYYEQQRARHEQAKLQEQRRQQKIQPTSADLLDMLDKQKEQHKIQLTSADESDKTLGSNSRFAYYGIAVLIVAGLAAYGAYRYMR